MDGNIRREYEKLHLICPELIIRSILKIKKNMKDEKNLTGL